ASLGDLHDCADKFRTCAALCQVPRGACLESPASVLLLGMHGQDEYGKRRTKRSEVLQQFEAAPANERDVENRHVPLLVTGQFKGFRRGSCITEHVFTWQFREYGF